MVGRISNLSAVGRGSPTAPHYARCMRKRDDLKYWQEQRWRLDGDVLSGYYRTYRGSYEGAIKLFQSGLHKYFIINPPRELAKHPHAPCFIYQGQDGLYWVHFNLRPKNVDAGIIVIETILRESLEMKP